MRQVRRFFAILLKISSVRDMGHPFRELCCVAFALEFIDKNVSILMKNGIVIIDKLQEGIDSCGSLIHIDRILHIIIPATFFSSRHQIGRPSIHDSPYLIGCKIAGADERNHHLITQEGTGMNDFRDRFHVQIPKDKMMPNCPDLIVRLPICRYHVGGVPDVM